MISENSNPIDNKINENDITVDEVAPNLIANVNADPIDIEITPPIEVVSVIGRPISKRGRPKIIDPVRKEFICDICNAKFDRKWKIKTHLEGHSTKENHFCETCGQGYKKLRSLWQHISRKHPKSSI